VSEHASASLPVRFFRLFLDTLTAEIGHDAFVAILEKADLPTDLTDPQAVSRYTSQSAAETYVRVQKAVRVFYGRGARGTLVRIGRLLWARLLESAPISEKTMAQFIRTLPPAMRRKAALELLARFMREKPSGATVHSLDLDLMLVDYATAVTTGQTEATPVCYVTLGLIQENLFWATARDHDIEEVSCRAAGGDDCEFKIKLVGK
jgi:predicted hydrocarbon binding protein